MTQKWEGWGWGVGAQFYACVPVSAHTPAEHNVKQSSEASQWNLTNLDLTFKSNKKKKATSK